MEPRRRHAVPTPAPPAHDVRVHCADGKQPRGVREGRAAHKKGIRPRQQKESDARVAAEVKVDLRVQARAQRERERGGERGEGERGREGARERGRGGEREREERSREGAK